MAPWSGVQAEVADGRQVPESPPRNGVPCLAVQLIAPVLGLSNPPAGQTAPATGD